MSLEPEMDLSPGELDKVLAALGAVLQAIDSGALAADAEQRARLALTIEGMQPSR